MSNAPIQTLVKGEPEPGDRIGEYEVVERLARGGMATVYGVRHVQRGEPRALKLLHPLAGGDESRGRFRREFRALSRLQHPNVLRVHESGMYHGRPWFTMERLEGHDLRQVVEALQSAPSEARFARAEDILKQVARALAYVHDRGLVHRDVTPGNVFVLSDGKVKLMDFGVVKEAGTDLTAVGAVIGTVAYMAPEQITGVGLDARADLYSLGAVLYLLLTGRRVFSAHTIHGFMEKHLNVRPRPPSEFTPDVPTHLEEICLRLLEKEPRDRFASASHLLHVLGDLEQRVDVDGQFPGRTVGRTLLRGQLTEAVAEVAAGRKGRAMILSGPSGQGKTRMLELAEHHARRLGLQIASGRCRHHARPFGAFVSIYRSLRGSDPPEVLEAVFRGDDNEGKVWERYPILSAFRDVVVANAPIVLIIDDLDRADPATVELLSYLIRNTLSLSEEPVLFLMGHDDGEQRIRNTLEELGPVSCVKLQPLDESEVEELVVSLLGNSGAARALSRRLIEEGDGSPALIAEMLRGLMDDGLIRRRDDASYELVVGSAEIARSNLPMPASLRQALHERLAALSQQALAIGRVLAHSRTRIDTDVLIDAMPMDEKTVMAALDELMDAGIVQEHRKGDVERVELAHGRFREVLAEAVPDKTRQGTHRALGEALERRHRGQTDKVVEELAYHFEQAALAPKAYQYLLHTAHRHLQRSLYHEALAFLDRATTMEPRARPYMLLDEADKRLAEAYLAQARARHALGQLPEAVQATQRAQALATTINDPGLEARVAIELGSQLRLQGSSESAEEQARLAIKRAEEAGDQRLLPRPLYQLAVIQWSKGDLAAAEKYWRQSLQIAQQLGDERDEGFGHNGLAIIALCRGNSMDARRWFEQSATLFERLGMLNPLVVARVNLTEIYVHTGILRKALALADRTVAQAEEVGHHQGIALGKAWRSRILLILGRAEEAEREATDALKRVRRVANREHETMVLGALVHALLAREHWARALDPIEQLLDVLDIHDYEGIHPQVAAWKVLVLSRIGRQKEARAAFQLIGQRSEHWPHVQIHADLALGKALMVLDRRHDAQAVLQRALAASESSGFRYLQLLSHTQLLLASDALESREHHARVASGLARSLAANLPPDDAERFLAVHEAQLTVGPSL
ncbi:MAG: protein kinase [Myxococcales bacterium]|nr:protein kinase [Myxococcales bacterium]